MSNYEISLILFLIYLSNAILSFCSGWIVIGIFCVIVSLIWLGITYKDFKTINKMEDTYENF